MLPKIIQFVCLLGFGQTVFTYSQEDSYQPYIKHYTTNITIKQGTLQGVVVEPRENKFLPLVEQYKGIPYAAPPVGELRFMPTRNAPSWTGIKYADSFGPVCPQKFPDLKTMSPRRKEKFLKLKQYLINQSEDCLYLNIYAPYQVFRGSRKYPVMVYIHGESFEWNSGNPYDGSVLAGYGNVIVVTFNFRLGILGFLKAGIEDESKSNFGLVDQLAALVWIRENIEAFGGNSESVTLFGDGTGAVCANLLTMSPMVLPANEVLFQRAILMGGTALADWAIAGNPRDITYQVSQALNCPIQEDFEACLRRKRLDEIMNIDIPPIPYRTAFGPVVDSRIVPNDPIKSMTNYTSIFSSFDLMYGVTEMESVNLLGSIALVHGMLQKERDQELRKYFRFRCEMKPELCVASTLAEYTSNIFIMDDEGYSTQPEAAYITRDSLLDIFSDARVVAPVVQMGKYHSMVNSASYFYVFKHPTSSKIHLRNKTSTGEELPYIFGVPLDGPSFHFTDTYTDIERLLSEVVMTYICNFAYSGNPNEPKRNEFYSLTSMDWRQFNITWPEFEVREQKYLEFGIPPRTGEYYRKNEVFFWNEAVPKLTDVNRFDPDIPNNFQDSVPEIPMPPPFRKPKGTPPWILTHHFGSRSTFRPPRKENIFGTLITPPPRRENNDNSFGTVEITAPEKVSDKVVGSVVYGSVINSSPDMTDTTTINIIIIAGCSIGFINVLVFLLLYYRCYKLKKARFNQEETEDNEFSASMVDKTTKLQEREAFLVNGCDLIKIISNSSKSDDTYEAVRARPEDKVKISRHLSNSTIDAHTKVRDWINNEIISKYSPQNLKKNRKPYVDIDINATKKPPTIFERTPARPFTPTVHTIQRPPLTKQNSLPNNQKNKVSVAVDATPSGRGPSVLAQQPIELTKSFDHSLYMVHREPPLRRSMTLDDFTQKPKKKVLKNIEENINTLSDAQVITIERTNKFDQACNFIDQRKQKKLLTFDPNCDVNVTSRDEVDTKPLSPEEALLTIKRRNFPKVLPEYPSRAALNEVMANKRRSMPVPVLHPPLSDLRMRHRVPPIPPVRTTSTLDRNVNNKEMENICISAPTLNEEDIDKVSSEGSISSDSRSSKEREIDPCYSNAKITSVQQANCEEQVFVPNFDPCVHHITPQSESDNDSDDDSSEDESSAFVRPEVVILHKSVSRNNSSGSESSPCESDTGTILETQKDEAEILTII